MRSLISVSTSTVLLVVSLLFLLLVGIATTTVNTKAPHPFPIPPYINSLATDFTKQIEAQSIKGGVLKSPKFKTFTEMDLLYLIDYQNWTFPLLNNATFCKPGSSEGESVTGADLSARVAFNATDADYYGEQFDVKEVPIINPALKKYRDLYLRMSELNCQSLVSSMMFCLCSYGKVATGINATLPWIQSNLTAAELTRVKAFVAYNADGPNTACRLGQALLDANGGLLHDVALEAFYMESRLWQLSPSRPDYF